MKNFNNLTADKKLAQLKLVVGEAIDTYNACIAKGDNSSLLFKSTRSLLKSYKVI